MINKHKESIIIELIKFGLEEYKWLREEILQSMRNRNYIANVGLGLLGILFYGGVRLISNSINAGKTWIWFTFFIFYFGIPLASFLVLVLWNGEITRMFKISVYLAEKENLINALIKFLYYEISNTLSEDEQKYFAYANFRIINWETYLRETYQLLYKKSRWSKIISSYYAIMAMFIGISAFSMVISLIFILPMLNLLLYVNWLFFTGGLLSIFIVVLSFKKYSSHIFSNLKK